MNFIKIKSMVERTKCTYAHDIKSESETRLKPNRKDSFCSEVYCSGLIRRQTSGSMAHFCFCLEPTTAITYKYINVKTK